MTRKQLAKALGQKLGKPADLIEEILESTFEMIRLETAQGNDVLISNFGRFTCVQCAERRQRNIRTGEYYTLPAEKKLRLRPYKAKPDSREL